MLYRSFSRLWLALPRGLRRVAIRLSHGSFTVSAAAVVVNSEDRVLVLRHLMRPEPWGLPGGFIDSGEQPTDAIRRELREETGIELNEPRLLMVRTVGRRHIEMLFAARSDDQAQIKSEEIVELGWYVIDELPDRLPSDQLAIAQAVLRGEV